MATPERSRDIGTKKVAVVFHQCSLHSQQRKQHKGGNYFIQIQNRQRAYEATKKTSSVEATEDKNVTGEGLCVHDLLVIKQRKEDRIGNQ